IKDIEQGFNDKNYQIEVDRKAAIKLAITESETQDMILIAGKGHENYQDIMGVKHPYSDIDYSQGLLAA
ncbi:MAG: UDP-N-acetylmuramoyl-L-alanyl-D-glutamate--2,6-diaminopimelate ligase, partial [Gammaproteobacteria bacterium]|nr:UDP-N-acetylmuramoyl-L-alanyl-D-glutamate--2,6-diaminopimelate ligase [Gammaproteobacteria bacterium]